MSPALRLLLPALVLLAACGKRQPLPKGPLPAFPFDHFTRVVYFPAEVGSNDLSGEGIELTQEEVRWLLRHVSDSKNFQEGECATYYLAGKFYFYNEEKTIATLAYDWNCGALHAEPSFSDYAVQRSGGASEAGATAFDAFWRALERRATREKEF